jgi:hypothetical protein
MTTYIAGILRAGEKGHNGPVDSTDYENAQECSKYLSHRRLSTAVHLQGFRASGGQRVVGWCWT